MAVNTHVFVYLYLISYRKRYPLLETPEKRKGCALDLPSPVFYEAATARAVQNTACNAWRGFRFGLLLAAAAALR